MKKTKKILSGLLAVLMLISMLTCFVLPATAISADDDVFYVGTRAELAAVIRLCSAANRYLKDKTIYLQNDIDYKKNYLDRFVTFAGTLDGKGHKIINVGAPNKTLAVSKGACLVGTLTGTIKNLTIDSTYYVVDNYSDRTNFGAFAENSNGGKIENCAYFGTYTTTAGVKAGGFVGNVETNGLTIKGCVFGGAVSSSTTGGTAGAFFGYKDDAAMSIIRDSIANGTLTGKNTGMACAYSYTADKNEITNSYAIGMKILPYGSSLTATMRTNASVEAAAKKTDLNEAVWTINEQTKSDGRYFNAGKITFQRLNTQNKIESYDEIRPCFGSFNDRVVKLTIDGNDAEATYYAPRTGTNKNEQPEIQVTSPSDKTPVVSGAEYRDGTIYVNHEDITVNYVNATDYTLQQKKDELDAMVKAYNAMEDAYVTKGDAINTWISSADTALKTPGVTEDNIDTLISQENTIDDGVKTTMSKPEDYPSIADYNTYKYVEEITDYKVATKDDWDAAVNMSNYVENPNAVDFKGITLHLTNNINMGGAEMLPLCYGWVFDGNLDGHNNAFEKINIKADNAYGPVGLIGAFGSVSGRKVENLGIASGSITVTGTPRYKSVLQCEEQGNKVGGFVGKAIGSSAVFRKCWNNADINVENVDAAAGIVADARNNAVIDSCFNMGTSKMMSGMYGIAGHAENSAKIYNSMSGATGDGLVQDRAGTYNNNANEETNIDTIIEAVEKNNINVCGVVATLKLNNLVSNAAKKRVQIKAQDQYNDENSAMSVAEAAWRVNANYKNQKNLAGGSTKRDIYFSLNKNGEVRFGRSTGYDQIYRIKLVCIGGRSDCKLDNNGLCTEHEPVYTYGAATFNSNTNNLRQITLDVDTNANYYASPYAATDSERISGGKVVTIKGNVLYFTDEVAKVADSGEDATTFEVYVGYDADRGNVHSNDNTINVLDVLAAVKMAVATNEAAKNKRTADLNNDYTVDINDAYQLVRHVFKYSKTLTFTPGKPAEREYLKVLTYNIKAFQHVPSAASNENNGDPFTPAATEMCRKDAVLAELKAINADIIGFQEIEQNDSTRSKADQMKIIKDALEEEANITMHSLFTITDPDTDGDGGGGSGILSKYPFVKKANGEEDCGKVYFADETMPDDPTTTLDDSNARAFTWVKISLNGNTTYEPGTDIIFVNCHFGEHHEEQIRFMIDYMEKAFPNSEGHRIVYVGDLNFAPHKMRNLFDKEEPYTFLNGGKYLTSFTRTNAGSGSLVDNVLVNGNVEYFQPLPNETGLYTRMGVYDREQKLKGEDDGQKLVKEIQDEMYCWSASDHLPVWAFIKK